MDADYQRPIVTVDLTLFTIANGRLCVALQRREKPPFAGEFALIGGYVHVDEDADALAAARRILRAKAGLSGVFLEQLMTFSGPKRDPRGWSASIAYYALAPEPVLAISSSLGIALTPVDAIGPLPFDHNEIVAQGARRLRTKGAYSSLPINLLPATFTMPQLREVYETVMGVKLNDSAFRRKIDELEIVEPVPGAFSKESARPAQLFRSRRAARQEFDRRI